MGLILGSEHEVVKASSGEEALSIFHPGEFAVVVCDLKMPGLSGIDVLEAIAKQDPGCARILLTAFGRRESIIDAVNRAKIYMYLDKPCDPGTIKLAIKRAAENWSLEKERKALTKKIGDMEKVAAVGRFASCVGHDIRNYLVPLLVACEEDDPEEMAESLETARHASEAILALVSEMQALAKGGAPNYQLKPGSLGDLLIDAKRWLRRSPAARNKDLTLEIEDLCTVMHSEASLRRVFVNLMKNALEAAPEGTTVKVQAKHCGETIEITVQDEGPGMPAEVASRCFDPFFTTKGENGTGLGLYICKTIINGHHGDIQIESVPKQGTKIRVVLPCEQKVQEANDGDITIQATSSSSSIHGTEYRPEA